MEQTPKNVSLQERSKNELISKMFPKIKVDEDGKIKIDDDNKRCQVLKEYVSITPGSSSNSSSKTLSPPDQNEGKTKSKNENFPKPQESNPCQTSNTTVTQAFSFVDSSSHPGQEKNKNEQEQQGLEHNKDVNFKSIPTIVVDDLQRTTEFQQLLEAIKSRDVSELEAALNDHRSVLHISTPDHRLVELSVKEALLSFNVRILDLVYEHWATAAMTSPSDRIDQLKRLTKTMIAAKDSCLDVLKIKKKVLLAQQCLVAYNKFRIHLHQQLTACQELLTTSDKKSNEAQEHTRKYILTALRIYEEYSKKIIELESFELIDEPVYRYLAKRDYKFDHKQFLIYNIFQLYYRKLDLCISHVILEHRDSKDCLFRLTGYYHDKNINGAVNYLLYRTDEDIYLQAYDNLKLKHVMSNNVLSDSNQNLIEPSRLVPYLEREEFYKAINRLIGDLYDPFGGKQLWGDLSYGRGNIEHFWLADTKTHNVYRDYLSDVHYLNKLEGYLEQSVRVIQRCPVNECLLLEIYILQTVYINFQNLDVFFTALIPFSLFRQLANLCQAGRACKFTKLLDLKDTQPDLGLRVAKEIELIKSFVADTIKIHKPILNKHLLGNVLELVSGRIKKLQDKNGSLKMLVEELFHLDMEELLITLKDNNTHFNKLMPKYGLTLELYSEIVMLVYNTKLLKRDLNKTKIVCMENMINNLQMYTDYIETVLKNIEQNITIEKNTELKNYNCNNSSLNEGWRQINSITTFLSTEFNLSIKISAKVQPDMKQINEVRIFLNSLEQESKTLAEIYELNKSPNSETNNTYKYEGIEQLIESLTKTKFLTKKEKEYLTKNVDRDFQDSEKYLPLLEKVLRGEEISTEQGHLILKNIDMNDRCKAIVVNLIWGCERPDCVLQCLAERATSLKSAIDGNNLAQLVQRYKVDVKFQLLVNTLILDIRDVLRYNDGCINDFSYIEFHLLKRLHPKGTDSVFKLDDDLIEIFRAVIILVEDELVLKELWQMQEDGLGKEDIKLSWNGPHSPRLQDYFELLSQDASQIANPPSGTSTSSEPLTLISTTALSAVLSSASEAAEAVFSAAAAASTADLAAVSTVTAAQAATSASPTTATVVQAAMSAQSATAAAAQATSLAAQAAEKVRVALDSIISSASTTDIQ